ncbi:hypothetical protein N7530_012421 [Penicillium desertorum]|uniref:Uncharacterized protein n=1 Tax=Penicillium desertorum TaxID=1303715 RepID=A0A9W9WFM7_9EURO|nr:hypothetical protein N7530_012421 [Penicillium desertorum]
MQFTKALFFLSALAPVAFAAEAGTADCVTKTLTLVPSGYTPPPSSTPTPTPTSTSTETPSSTWTPVITSTPSSTPPPPLIKASSVPAGEASATPSAPATAGAASIHLPGFMAAGAAAIAGLLMV